MQILTQGAIIIVISVNVQITNGIQVLVQKDTSRSRMTQPIDDSSQGITLIRNLNRTSCKRMAAV